MSNSSPMLGDELETGKSKFYGQTRLQATAAEHQQALRQGMKRRHPNRVLSQYDGVVNTTTEAGDLYTKSLVYETKKAEMPKDFRPKGDSDFMANQIGVVATAFTNYKASKKKLERMFTVGN